MIGTAGKIIIKPSMAELKTDKTIIFKADPYCVFFLGNQKLRTSACKKGGKHPIWNDALIFERTTEDILIVQIWDKDIISKDDFICEGSINVSNLLKSGVQSLTIDLYNKGIFIGKLFMEFEFVTPQKTMPQNISGPIYSETHIQSTSKF